ncbi:hypothetical protein [Nocardioides sp. W7]|uniref:hypothetical protein n=1 Tax=Nocardioides sp. W7 TaxID=2931390 RepID=UPI001FD5D321|nr:hypothetical protein [Nocardioides sp. W7]
MSDPFTLPQRLVVSPPLDASERDLVAGLGLWPGRPRPRSPWSVCADGCCLDLADGVSAGLAEDWLRFLLRELLSPRARVARERAAAVGLQDHRVDGRVLVDVPSPMLIAVRASRVRSLRLDDEQFAVEDRPRAGPGEVVELRRDRAQSTER